MNIAVPKKNLPTIKCEEQLEAALNLLVGKLDFEGRLRL